MNDQISPWKLAGLSPPCEANMMGVICEGHLPNGFHIGKFSSHKGKGLCFITWKYEPHLN